MVLDVAAGATSSRFFEAEKTTTGGVDIAEDSTNGVPTTETVCQRKPDTSTCRLSVL